MAEGERSLVRWIKTTLMGLGRGQAVSGLYVRISWRGNTCLPIHQLAGYLWVTRDTVLPTLGIKGSPFSWCPPAIAPTAQRRSCAPDMVGWLCRSFAGVALDGLVGYVLPVPIH